MTPYINETIKKVNERTNAIKDKANAVMHAEDTADSEEVKDTRTKIEKISPDITELFAEAVKELSSGTELELNSSGAVMHSQEGVTTNKSMFTSPMKELQMELKKIIDMRVKAAVKFNNKATPRYFVLGSKEDLDTVSQLKLLDQEFTELGSITLSGAPRDIVYWGVDQTLICVLTDSQATLLALDKDTNVLTILTAIKLNKAASSMLLCVAPNYRFALIKAEDKTISALNLDTFEQVKLNTEAQGDIQTIVRYGYTEEGFPSFLYSSVRSKSIYLLSMIDVIADAPVFDKNITLFASDKDLSFKGFNVNEIAWFNKNKGKAVIGSDGSYRHSRGLVAFDKDSTNTVKSSTNRKLSNLLKIKHFKVDNVDYIVGCLDNKENFELKELAIYVVRQFDRYEKMLSIPCNAMAYIDVENVDGTVYISAISKYGTCNKYEIVRSLDNDKLVYRT